MSATWIRGADEGGTAGVRLSLEPYRTLSLGVEEALFSKNPLLGQQFLRTGNQLMALLAEIEHGYATRKLLA